MVSNWRRQAWEFGWDPANAIGGHNPLWPDDLICVLLSNDGAVWKVRWNPANQRSILELFYTPVPPQNAWDVLESFVGPD